ncbi:MAG: hypothetical protein HQ582_06585 [Planctomycetes bacterium]|nr:hypothetical protein [Planctomycetota bacterium]
MKNDPHRKLQATIAGVLFYSGNAQKYTGVFRNGEGMETVDRDLLIAAIKSILTNPNGGARSYLAKIYPAFTEEDLEHLWGDIYKATKGHAPSGVMFSVNIQDAGLTLLAKHRFIEGMELAAYHLFQDRHAMRRRIPFFIDILKGYGTLARPLIPEFRKTRIAMIEQWGMLHSKRNSYIEEVNKKFDEVEASTETPEVRNLKRYLK